MLQAFRIPADLSERLETLATKTNRSKSFYLREALEEHIDDLEDFYLADARYESFKGKAGAANAERTFTLDELEQSLGLAA